MTTSPFDKLIVEETEIDNQQLADLLEPFLVIVRSTKTMEFLPAFQKLPNDLKIMVVLAGSKATASIFSQAEEIAPKTIIDLDVAPEGSIKSTLKRLLDNKEIKSRNQKYYLPNYKIAYLADKLKEGKVL